MRAGVRYSVLATGLFFAGVSTPLTHADAQSLPAAFTQNASTPANAAATTTTASGGSANAAAMYVPGAASVSPTGAFTYSIPIVVPPGTAGMVPSLSLNYSSSTGDGPEGVGWYLGGLSAITRCPRTVAQDGIHGGVNYDAGTGAAATNDRFCLNGQRLILVSGNYGAENSRYRTEIETFTNIIAHCDVVGTCSTTNGPDWFEVRTKSGQILSFGNTASSSNYSRIPISNPPPSSLPIVREWLENNVADHSGNYFTVTYDSGLEGLPSEIDYTGHSSSPTVAPYNKVEFKYGARQNPYKVYQAGSSTELTWRLSNIKTYAGSNLVSNYVIGYNSVANNSAQLNELSSISRCSNDSGPLVCLAPTTFGWQGTRDAINLAAPIPEHLAQGGSLLAGDWNGDGLTDVLFDSAADNYCNLYLGAQDNVFHESLMTVTYVQWVLEGQTFVPVQVTNGKPCFHDFANYGSTTETPVDFTGDGFSDLVITQDSNGGPYVEGLTNSAAGTLVQNATGAGFSGALGGVGDFDGDGLTDIVIADTIYTSQGNGTFKAGAGIVAGTFADFDGDGCTDVLGSNDPGLEAVAYSCNPAVPDVFLGSLFADGTVVTGDFNGDGKTDIVYLYNTAETGLYLSTGTGFDSKLPIPAAFSQVGSYLLNVGDFNGDGKDDIAIISAAAGDDGVTSTIYLSTGSGFVQANDSSGNPITISGFGNATIADWNNDGAADIWFQQDAGDELYFINYVPELINSVSTGLCASCTTATVTYDRLNHGTIYTKGSGSSYPTQDVVNSSYVVKSVSSNNGVGGTNSVSYAYAGAKQDLQGRGFLGFATVTATDSRTGIVTQTNYSTLFPLTGTPTSQIISSSGTVLSHVNYTFTPTPLVGTQTLVELTEIKQTVHQDLDGTNMPLLDTTYTYDGYANPWVTTSTITTGSTTSSVTTRTQTYTYDTSTWLLAKPAEDDTESNIETGCTTNCDRTRHTTYTTDPTSGMITSAILENTTTLALETDYGYDAFGNIHEITQKSPVAHDFATRATTYNFNTSNGEFLQSINYPTPSSGVAQNATFTFDTRFGGLTSRTDVNSQTTVITYDGFGRTILKVNPDLTGTQLTYTYCSGINGGTASCTSGGAYYVIALPILCNNQTCASPSTNGPDTKTTSDLLQRPILQASKGFDGSDTFQNTIYDGQLHVFEASRPIFSGGTYVYTKYYYDALDRVMETDAPTPSGTNTTKYGYDGRTTSVAIDATGKDQISSVLVNPQGLVDTVTDAKSGQTSYVYEAFGNATTITTLSHVITNQYDVRGRKTSFVDSDMGSGTQPWTYQYDALSELTQQTDAASNITTFFYDVLGRMTSRDEADYNSSWIWDTATNGVGKLAEACNATACSGATYTYTPSYDTRGRPSSDTMLINGTSYTYGLAYNAQQQLAHVAYPSGFQADYNYTSLGYLSSIVADGSGTAVWTANTVDAELRVTEATAGNNVTTSNAFDPDTGDQTNVGVGVAATPYSIAFLSYQWDRIGNLTSRTDHIGTNKTESFCYDELNRLTSYGLTTSSTCPVTASGAVTVSYAASGNIGTKSDVGTYSYGAGGAGSHAVTSIAGTVAGVTNPNFIYTANGNLNCMTTVSSCGSGVARNFNWKSFNKVSSVNDNITGNQFALTYDTNHARIRQCSPGCTTPTTETDYVNDPVTGTMEEVVTSGSSVTFNDYIQAAGQIVAMRTHTTSSTTWLYLASDHLGSISIITDSTGALISGGRQAYDSWGLRRNTNWTPAVACNSISSATTRGYTQQEEIDGGCLVNLNGRIYDPTIGRLISADPYVSDPMNTQNYNRYSYVNNGPLSATDPSGYTTCTVDVVDENGTVTEDTGPCPDLTPTDTSPSFPGGFLTNITFSGGSSGRALVGGTRPNQSNSDPGIPCSQGPSTQYFVGGSGTLAIFVGVTVSANLGVSYANDPNSIVEGMQIFGSFSIAGHIGLGAFIGAGGQAGTGHSNGPLASGATIPFDAEVEAGAGPSVGVSGQASQNSISAAAALPIPKVGAGIGAYGGAGAAVNLTGASPQLFCHH